MPNLRFSLSDQRPSTAFVAAWNDLWNRCDGIQPSVQAECIEHWRQTFRPDSRMLWFTVLQGDRAVAGLPLIECSDARFGRVWNLPVNSDVHAGDLLLDLNGHPQAACREIVRGLSRLGFGWLRLDEVELDAPRWQHLLTAARAESLAVSVGHPSPTGVVDIGSDWGAYVQSWSGNHRSSIKRSRRKLDMQGTVQAECVTQATDAELRELMELCFALEDRSWKGAAGTSVLRVPGLREYYLQEAQIMRDRSQLHLWLLRLDGRIIAFEYCHLAHGTCYSHKLSFDPRYAAFSPGRILRYHQLESYFGDPNIHLLDTLGSMCRAKAAWATRVYRTGRLTLSTGNAWSRRALRAYRRVRPWLRRWRPSAPTEPPPGPGASRYLDRADLPVA